MTFEPTNSVHYGRYRIEFYETSETGDDVPTLKITAFLSITEPIEWLMSQENQLEIRVEDVLTVTDTEILDVKPEDGLLTISVDQNKIYAFLAPAQTERPINELVLQVLRRFFLEEFGQTFAENEYDLRLEAELTDFFG